MRIQSALEAAPNEAALVERAIFMESKIDIPITVAEVGDSTRSTVKRPPSLPALTGLRFFAALAVLMFHFGAGFAARGGVPTSVVRLLQNGYLGVSLFFVLSGFILTYTHQWDVLDRHFLADFYVARFARIYPVYLLALLVALPVLAHPLSLADVVAVLSMTQSWTPPRSSSGYLWIMQAWTLSVEFAFYLIFPAILLFARKLNTTATALVAASAAAVIVIYGISSVPPGTPWLPYLSSTQLPIPLLRSSEFIYGVMLCRLTVHRPRLSTAIGGHLFELLMIATIIAILCLASNVHSKALFTVMIGFLIVQLAGGYGVISTALSSNALLLLGGASYALYLFQGPVRALCEQYIAHPFDRFVSPVATLGCAIVVFLFWEQPCRRLILSSYKQFANA